MEFVGYAEQMMPVLARTRHGFEPTLVPVPVAVFVTIVVAPVIVLTPRGPIEVLAPVEQFVAIPVI